MAPGGASGPRRLDASAGVGWAQHEAGKERDAPPAATIGCVAHAGRRHAGD
jgi:hypothetical protein